MPINKISTLIEKIRKEKLYPLAKPISTGSFRSIKAIMQEEGFPGLDDCMYDLYKVSDGVAYNGVELFSCLPDSLMDGDYTLPDIISSNQSFRQYYSDYEDYKESFIYLGRTDEDLLLFDAELGKYLICAREDLMVYEEAVTFEAFIRKVFKGRF